MANEAFALSPMSARAAEPNEQDYDAIREAFMETARGRWFLGEYAKRNRNADTRMVLDAVAKIEETLAAQRQPVVEDRVPEVLAAIRRAVREAETLAGAAFDPSLIEASLGPIQRGVRIIKEISWRWREIGADGRICDLIDSQLAAIEGACGQVTTIDPRVELRVAFDLLKDQIEQAGSGGATARQAPAAPPPPAPAQEAPDVAEAPPADIAMEMAVSEPPAAVAETAQEIAVEPEPEIAATDVAETMEAPAVENVGAIEIAEVAESPIAVDVDVAEPAALAEVIDEPQLDAAAEAEDEAVLAAIAMEMAAPDPEFDEIIGEFSDVAAEVQAPVAEEPVAEEPAAAEPIAAEPFAAEPVVAEPVSAGMAETIAQLREAIAEAATAVMERPEPVVAQVTSLPMPSPVPMPAPAPEPSLGATILASGMLKTPRTAANDPLAPIRRMTQVEKIAFFS
ncbi:hypothetical protein JQ596_11060 [Bradyrhizobium manausense]|uniref:hypothetical protein n=1 Tax=Bradyrhizobium TaxID=374 RepID=UPI001BAA36D4|nr:MULTISPECIES: hypothetical protein [Bradyrhizobium]MBR0826079.1 hypothetical protein [Bradyrhizobium manausense]UVO31889.1 hypothetical protein KUF59_15330 [Bradyrhizobium arachidis]